MITEEFCGHGVVASAIDADGTLILAERYADGGFYLEYVVDYIRDGGEEFTAHARRFPSKRVARRYFAERVTELYG